MFQKPFLICIIAEKIRLPHNSPLYLPHVKRFVKIAVELV